jgi:hypothetical protein
LCGVVESTRGFEKGYEGSAMNARQRRKQMLRRLDTVSIVLIVLGVVTLEISRPFALTLFGLGVAILVIAHIFLVVHWVLSLFSR